MRKEKSKDITFGIAIIMIAFTGLLTMMVLSNRYLDVETPKSITGMATGIYGCCEQFCTWKEQLECPAYFTPNKRCDQVDNCRVGCCIDKEGYCHINYIKGKCIRQEGKYYQKECQEIPQCPNPNLVSPVMSNTGIRLEYNPASGEFINVTGPKPSTKVDYATADPYSAFRGSFIEIRYFMMDAKDVQKVDAILRDGTSQIARISLYDDGSHNDGNVKDGIYGAVWDSARSSLTGMKQITVDITITKNGREETVRRAAEFVLISDVRCLPLKPISKSRDAVNIILLGNNYGDYGGMDKLNEDINNNLDAMSLVNPFSSNADSINYYMIDNMYQFISEKEAEAAIIKECSFFNTTESIAVIFDYNEPKCRRVSEEIIGIFILSPESYYIAGSKISLKELKLDACRVMKTLDEKLNSMNEGIPSATLITQDNEYFWTNKVNVRFIVTDDKDINVSYELNVDGSGTGGRAAKDLTVEKELNLTNGGHMIYVKASDSDGNSAVSRTIRVHVNNSISYSINMSRPVLDQVIREEQLEIIFKISHSQEINVSYSLFLDDVQKDTGTVDIGQDKSVLIRNLNQGFHDITIESRDAEGRKISYNTRFEVVLTG